MPSDSGRPPHVLIAGVSTRAAAQSAGAAGFAVTVVDAFGDRDQPPAARVIALRRADGHAFTPRAAAAAVRDVDASAVAYLSNFENDPDAVAVLAEGRRLWGNPPDVLRAVRDPRRVRDALRQRGLPALDVRTGEPGARRRVSAGADRAAEWLVKPLASGGGHRIRRWRAGGTGANEDDGGHDVPPAGSYLQRAAAGDPGSLVFVAAGGRVAPLGLTRQLIGEPALGVDGYRYCGSILLSGDELASAAGAALLDAARAQAEAVTEAFALTGVNGCDFVAQGAAPALVEVNPRWSASMELVERAYGVSVFAAHAAACSVGALPPFDVRAAGGHTPAVGKAIVFARRAVTTGDTDRWLEAADVCDVPRAGERIGAGWPVCTVLAAGRDAGDCRAALLRRAAIVYEELAGWADAR